MFNNAKHSQGEFMKNVKQVLDEDYNVSVTENGALGYKTTCRGLLDLNFKVSSLRNADELEIENAFLRAFTEDKKLAIKWLFYAGDVRGGVGERRLFRICLRYLAIHEQEILKKVLRLVPEYTRWDNYLCLIGTPLENDALEIIREQVTKDMFNMGAGKSISLASKWLPSINASSDEARTYAKVIIKYFGISQKGYRKMLSSLRSYSDVVEVKMSSKHWGDIDYEKVPSRANLIYRNAFLRNDKERRTKYLEALNNGYATINSGVLFPHDIVAQYMTGVYYGSKVKPFDESLEKLWEALPDFVRGEGSTICVADGSGSMYTGIGKTRTRCIDVANALALYFAERCSGEFKDRYITFSAHPKLVDLVRGKNLRERILIALQHNEVANTNIESVFDLILDAAIKGKMKQEELPRNVLILSDMEFDEATDGYSVDKKLFSTIKKKYEENGYELPRLVFWNICSRTNTIPVKQNENGVALVSGFSPAIINMVLSNELDPFKCLVEQLNSKRYAPIEEFLGDIS